MGLRLRFNIVLTIVFLLGLGGSGALVYQLLQNNARDEVVRTAELMIEAARAIRSYTVERVRPELAHRLAETFLPQTVPAYAATSTRARLPANYRDYDYKEAVLNPTNPNDRAADWEADLIRDFQHDSGRDVITGVRETPTGPSLFIARPLKVTNKACLTCHSTPSVAPASMIALYGSANGFGWQLDQIVGAQVVSVPMALPIRNANRAFLTFLLSLCGVFVVLYVALNLMLSRMIVRPVTEMARMADAVSTGDFDIPEFNEKGRSEIHHLGASFNRMRRSLEQAMRMIE